MLNYHLLFSKVYYEPGCIALIIACCVVTDPWLGLFAASGDSCTFGNTVRQNAANPATTGLL